MRIRVLTDARCNVRSTLLVTSGTSVTRGTGYTVFARTLAGTLVTSFPGRPNRVTVTRCNTQHAKLGGG